MEGRSKIATYVAGEETESADDQGSKGVGTVHTPESRFAETYNKTRLGIRNQGENNTRSGSRAPHTREVRIDLAFASWN